MKVLKKISLGLSILLGLTATLSKAQEPSNVTIYGTIKDMPDMPSKIYLVSISEATGYKLIDSAVVKNGKYQLSGGHVDIDVPITGAITRLNTLKGATFNDLSMFLMSAGSTINITSQGKIGSQGRYEITGSEAAVDYKNLNDKIAAQFAIDIKDYVEAQKKGDLVAIDKAKQNFLLKYKEDFITHSARLRTAMVKSFVMEHPQSSSAAYFLSLLYQMSIPVMPVTTLDSLMALLPASSQERAKAYIAGGIQGVAAHQKRMAAQLKVKDDGAYKVVIGTVAPDFTQNDVHGKPLSLSSLKGKYVLVDFWASWCRPCREENPNVVKMYQAYKNKNFTVLGVSLDSESSKDAWLKAIQHDGLNWTQVSDLQGWKNSAAKLYNVTAIPQNFLIDPNGVIIATSLRGEDLQEQLATLIK